MTADREAVTALATRRFGWSRPLIGTASELVDAYGTLAERGVERVYTWFCDFAPPDMLAEFGEDVIAPLRGMSRAWLAAPSAPAGVRSR